MNFSALRRRHKKVLVDHAFKVFLPKEQVSYDDKEFWIERLLNGHDFNLFIAELKKGVPDAQSILISRDQAGESKVGVGQISIVDTDLEFHAGGRRTVRVRVDNSSGGYWETSAEMPLFASYHWYDQNGNVYDFDGKRTALPKAIASGDQLAFELHVVNPAEPGNYQLMVTLVLEGQLWMEDNSLSVERVPVEVLEYDGDGLTRQARDFYQRLKRTAAEVKY